jgi:hypothetical protein
MSEAAGDPQARPGVIAVRQTFGKAAVHVRTSTDEVADVADSAVYCGGSCSSLTAMSSSMV